MELLNALPATRSIALLSFAMFVSGCLDWDARALSDGGSARDSSDSADAPHREAGRTNFCDQHADAIICDDFTDGLANGWSYDKDVRIEDAPTSGSRALHAVTMVRGESAAVGYTFATPRSSGTLYVRAQVYIPREAKMDQVDFISFEGDSEGSVVVLLLRDQDTEGATSFFASGGLSNPASSSRPDSLAKETWQCIEIAMTIASSPNGSITLSKNGARFESGNVTDGNTLPVGGFRQINLPISYLVQDAPFEVWLDDVVIDDQPIGCE